MLVETEVPQVEVETTQHTPNPAAQEPSAVPVMAVHSEEVTQVPFWVAKLALEHSWLGNWTMLNSDNCPKQPQIQNLKNL